MAKTNNPPTREQQVVNMLYGNMPSVFFGSLFNIALVAFVLSRISPSVQLIVWTSIAIFLNLIRWHRYKLFLKHPDSRSSKSWIITLRTMTFIFGCHYGVLAIFFFNSANPEYQALIIFLIGGMGTTAVGTYSVDLLTYRLYLFSSVLPLIARCFYELTEVYVTFAIMLSTFVIVMLRAAKQANKALIENFDMSVSLNYRATHDPLVGLLNREEFKNLFIQEQAIMRSEGKMLAMIFIDLDNFKILNDTYGHQSGDKALVKVGEIVRTSIRKEDIAARFGGDEFLILIQADDLKAIKTVANKIMSKIDAFQESLGELSEPLGASMGISYTHDASVDFDFLLAVADRACYTAKREGKGKICSQKAD